MVGKRALAARLCAKSGITKLLEILPRSKGLFVLNYHRIGNPADTPYDPGTFGPTAEDFDWQASYLKRHFDCVTLEEALAMIEGAIPLRPSLLLTFDDGYVDNYQLAFPLLRSHQMQAVFFLPTAFIGTQRLPWWDVIAYIVKNSRHDVIQLRYPERAEFRFQTLGAANAIMHLLGLCCKTATTDYNPLIEELENVCDCPRPNASAERCFMNWDEAREMQQGGMAFGSHTHTHAILSGLTAEQQRFELFESRAILQRELGRPIDMLSYPVGLPYTFNSDTVAILKAVGFTAGFSFYGGLNHSANLDPYDVRRCASIAVTNDIFRLQTTLTAVGAANSGRMPEASLEIQKPPVPASDLYRVARQGDVTGAGSGLHNSMDDSAKNSQRRI